MTEIDNQAPGSSGGVVPVYSLIDLIAVLVKWRWLIIGVSVGAFILAFLFLLATKMIPPDASYNIFPDKFKPTARVLISEAQENGPLSSILNQGGAGVLSGILGGGGVSSTRAQLTIALLKNGVTIKDKIAAQFNFTSKYKITAYPITTAREMFSKNLSITMDKTSGILELGYRDVDRIFATNVVNRTVELLEQEFRRLSLDKVDLKLQYLEDSILATQKEADKASQDLAAFQSKYGVIDLPSQANESIRQVSNLQAQIYSKQVELALQEKYLPENDARIVRLKNEIVQYRQLIEEIKQGPSNPSAGPVGSNRLPQVSIQYMNLKRDAELRQSILALLQQQREAAKLESLNTSRTLQIVERAEIPEKKAYPSRGTLLVVLTVVAFFLSVVLAYILNYFDKAKSDPIESNKLRAISRMLRKGGTRREG